MQQNLPFGLRDGKLVHISDVNSGLACNCFCPGCGAVLVARKGEQKIHHFAHYNSEECAHGFETAIHIAAKDLLENRKEFTIPHLVAKLHELDFEDHLIAESRVVKFDNVYLEKVVDNIVPDVLVEIGSKKLLIEIAVTHYVDEEKQVKIENLGISTVEVDLNFLKKDFNFKDLEFYLIRDTSCKKWIYNAQFNSLKEGYLNRKLKKRLEGAKNVLFKEELEAKKEYYRNQKFDILYLDEYSEITCPRIVLIKSKELKNTSFSKYLKEGKIWNGIIYGQRSNGRFVFLGGEKVEIYPPDNCYKLNDQERKLRNHIYWQANFISKESLVGKEDCIKCIYFTEYLDLEETTFACKFRKENRIK